MGAGHDRSIQIALFDEIEFIRDAQRIENPAERARVFCRPEPGELMEGDFELESTATKLCATSSRDVVSFHEEGAQSCPLEEGCSRESGSPALPAPITTTSIIARVRWRLPPLPRYERTEAPSRRQEHSHRKVGAP